MIHKVTVSRGNSKIGSIPNISLPPGKSCRPGVPCLNDCYAKKAYTQYPATRRAWDGNLEAYLANPAFYFVEITNYLAKKKPPWFRIHTSGDCPDHEYFHRMKELCREFPETKFLMFTKFYSLDFSNIPENYSVVLSCWVGMDLPLNTDLPRAWMQDGTETRMPLNTLECSGSCTVCSFCWNLKKIEYDIYFLRH